MKKWVWITVPAVVVGLGLIFLGGAVFAQEPGANTTPGVNGTAMYDFCRNIMTGNSTATDNGFAGMRGYCQNATADGNFGPGGMMGGMMGNGGMMGHSGMVGGMMNGGMTGNGSGRGMMSW